MSLCRFHTGDPSEARIGLLTGDHVIPFAANKGPSSIRELLQLTGQQLRDVVAEVRNSDHTPVPAHDAILLAPIDVQEVWAAGVTYLRSRDARMEESSEQDVYERVYNAGRPEIFFKATPSRVSGPGEAVAIRGDSSWDVPEPELALVINAHGETVGYTVGNDMSSRSIEGDNPLYLPQAKMYSACAGLGPVIALADDIADARNLPIGLTIERDGATLLEGETSTDQMARTFDDLVGYLHRYNAFPFGVFLMTGTGIIPPSEFTLEDGDIVSIVINGVGTLTQPVVRLT
jgi:2-dehydro-3-deoxy-D-arabinonate dehydratase